MKLIKTANGKRTIRISKSEWQKIGRTAGWDRSEEEIKLLEATKQDAIMTAEQIKLQLESQGYTVPEISVNEKVCIKKIRDGDDREHNVNIELKPWANKNNKKYELRNGVILMVGPYAHKRFKRKRFSPKNPESIMKYIKEILKYSVNMEKLRRKRSEKAEVARAQKFEAARQQSI